MKRAILLAISTVLLLSLFAAAAEGVQARLRPGTPSVAREPAPLPREWRWQRKAVVFDDMIRER
jgi:hypothetical protein